MKTNELMIGDWVYNRIADITFQVYPQFFSQWHNRPDQFEVTIQPIPLTVEILEKNGWLSRMNGTGEFYLKEPLVDDAILTKTIMSFQMNHGPFCGLSIHYVHELQHALRLCGIEHEIILWDMKIPFDIKFKPQIESGKYKVITAKGQSVRIICWDRNTTYWKIIGLVLAPDGKTENPFTYDVNGKESEGWLHNHELDLFIVTPEPELSEFEKCVKHLMEETIEAGDTHNLKPDSEMLLRMAKQQILQSGELLGLARKELCEQVVDHTKEAYENGKAEALKDLPRWRISKCPRSNMPTLFLTNNGSVLYKDGYELGISDLDKLPKEEDHE